MQTDNEARESYHEHSSTYGTKQVNALGQVSSCPEYETRHPSALQHNCERNQDGCFIEFVCRRHIQMTHMLSRDPAVVNAFINDVRSFRTTKCLMTSIMMKRTRISGARS